MSRIFFQMRRVAAARFSMGFSAIDSKAMASINVV